MNIKASVHILSYHAYIYRSNNNYFNLCVYVHVYEFVCVCVFVTALYIISHIIL